MFYEKWFFNKRWEKLFLSFILNKSMNMDVIMNMIEVDELEKNVIVVFCIFNMV